MRWVLVSQHDNKKNSTPDERDMMGLTGINPMNSAGQARAKNLKSITELIYRSLINVNGLIELDVGNRNGIDYLWRLVHHSNNY